MTDADSILPFQNGGYVQNPFNLRGEKSLSNQDAPQNLSISYVYVLPFGKGTQFLNQSFLLDEIFGGWSIGGVQSYSGSNPISFGCADQIPGTDNCVRWNHAGSQYLSAAAHRSSFNPDTDNYFLNPGQTGTQLFTDPESNVGSSGGYELGNVSRFTSARGFNFLNENFSLSKQFDIKGGTRFELRAEAFNAFNRHIFADPDTYPLDSGFGTITGTKNGSRNMQITGRFIF
jgi:hypothetical protein